MITPLKMLDIQADLVERAWHSDPFLEIISRMLELQMKESVGAKMKPSDLPMQVATAYHHFRQCARLAYPFRVSTEMTRMVSYAAEQMGDTEQILPEDVPTPWGLVYFDGGLKTTDGKGAEMITHWMMWGPAQYAHDTVAEPYDSGVVFFSFNDMLEGPDRFSLEILNSWSKRTKQVAGRWGYIGMNHAAWGTRVGPSIVKATGLNPNDPGGTNTLRLLLAFWAISQQELADVTEHRAVPQQKGMLKRAKIQPRVSTIALRRRASHHIHAEGEGHTHSVRYPVRGHWRNQAYGPGRALRRRIWIADQWRGPEDAPIVTRGKVYDVMR